jgi:FKBP-type peptidyl-prolyl cis-trans isomerase FkpA
MRKYQLSVAFSLFVALVVLTVGCEKDSDSFSQAEYDEKVILEYTSKLIMPFEKHESGIYYNIIKEGEGENPVSTSTVTVKYEGWLIESYVFDATKDDKTATFDLDKVIKGWQIGVPLIKPGGQIRLIVPSSLGYGASPSGSIPANSVLVFDVELISFENVAQ